MKTKFLALLLFVSAALFVSCVSADTLVKKHTLEEKDLDVIFTIKGDVEDEMDYQGNTEQIVYLTVNASVKSKISRPVSDIRFSVYAEDKKGGRMLLYDNTDQDGSTTPAERKVAVRYSVPGRNFQSLYGNISYEDGNSQSFYEPILPIVDSELDAEDYRNSLENPYVGIDISLNDQQEDYDAVIALDFTESFDHFDFQSWLVTSTEEVFPFLGIYSRNSDDTIISTDNMIPKNINADEIYIRYRIWKGNQNYEYAGKIKISDLLE